MLAYAWYKIAKTEDYSGNSVLDLRTCFNFQLLLFFFVLPVNYQAHEGFELGLEGFRSREFGLRSLEGSWSRLEGQVLGLGLGLVGSGPVNIPVEGWGLTNNAVNNFHDMFICEYIVEHHSTDKLRK